MNENVYLFVGVALLLVRILGNNNEPPMPPPSVHPPTIVTSPMSMPNQTFWQPPVQDHQYLIHMLERERRLRQQANSRVVILLLILVIILTIVK